MREHPVFKGYFCDHTGTFIYSAKRKRNLKIFENPPRYPSVWITPKKGFKGHSYLISWFVYETFIGPRNKKMHICHNDNNPRNNHISNLREDTPAGNNQDKWKHGTIQIGIKNNNHKLTEIEVLQIVDYLKQGKPYSYCAQKYGVTNQTINSINRGKTWGWLTGR